MGRDEAGEKNSLYKQTALTALILAAETFYHFSFNSMDFVESSRRRLYSREWGKAQESVKRKMLL